MPSLTVDEFREHVTTSLGDSAIELLLGAAWQAIATVAGEEGDVVDVADGGGSYVFLSRQAGSIDSVKEWLGYSYERTLDADNYRLRSDGVSLRRLDSGSTPASRWVGPVEVTFTAEDDLASRHAAQLKLVETFLNHHPGLAEIALGDWRERFASSSEWGWVQERQAILDSLRGARLEFA